MCNGSKRCCPVLTSAQVVIVDASDDVVSRTAIEKMASALQNTHDVLTIITSASPGRALQMNRGAQVCSADVLLFLHADTRLPEDALSCICKAIDGGYGWGRFDIQLDAHGFMFRMIEWSMNWRSAISGIATGDQGIFCKKNII